MIEKNVDAVIIGSGPAGLAAACKMKEMGIDPVVIERDNILGGILPQCIHPGFGLVYFKEELTGPEFIQRFIDKAKGYNIDIKLNTMVLEIEYESYMRKRVIAVNPDEGVLCFNTKVIILAMGCRERTRQNINMPGTRPSGVYTAGTAQRLMDIEGLMPGKEVVILGSGDIGLIMARRFTLENAKVKMVVEIQPYLCGLTRNRVQCLNDFDIPLLLSHTIVDIHGYERVEGVTIARVDENFVPIKGTEKYVACDCVIISVGLIPENELSTRAGISIDPATGGPIVSEELETEIPGIYACGNVLLVNDLVDFAVEQAEIAAESASKFIKNSGRIPMKWKKVIPGKGIRLIVPHKVSGKVDVSFLLRVEKPVEDAKIVIPEIAKKIKIRRAVPGEMIRINLKKEEIIKSGDRLTFSMEVE